VHEVLVIGLVQEVLALCENVLRLVELSASSSEFLCAIDCVK
jgi:hypothetical protein